MINKDLKILQNTESWKQTLVLETVISTSNYMLKIDRTGFQPKTELSISKNSKNFEFLALTVGLASPPLK